MVDQILMLVWAVAGFVVLRVLWLVLRARSWYRRGFL